MDDDRTIKVKAAQDIPIGHKIALKNMAVGDTVLKYGVDIGKVVAPIKMGEHAHVHNIKTKRW
jgi:(2R)-sulfolactate sulfo-lyase subunit alpha